MDFKQLATSETAICVIKDPRTGQDTDIQIELYGVHTKHFRAMSAQFAGKDDNEGFLAALTKSWQGIEDGDKPLDFSEENAKRVYSEVPVIAGQVDQFIVRQSNFLPKASKG